MGNFPYFVGIFEELCPTPQDRTRVFLLELPLPAPWYPCWYLGCLASKSRYIRGRWGKLTDNLVYVEFWSSSPVCQVLLSKDFKWILLLKFFPGSTTMFNEIYRVKYTYPILPQIRTPSSLLSIINSSNSSICCWPGYLVS